MLMILYPAKIHAHNCATVPRQEENLIKLNRIIVTVVGKFTEMQCIV